jgi:hypothetical protein
VKGQELAIRQSQFASSFMDTRFIEELNRSGFIDRLYK